MPPEPIWAFSLKDERRVGARAPVIDGDALYQIFYYDRGNSSESVCIALDILTGTERWRFVISHVANEPVVGSDGMIYVSSFEGLIYAIDRHGALRWKAPDSHRNLGMVSLVGPDRIAVAETGGGAGKTWCLDAQTGQALWSFDSGGHSYRIAATRDLLVHASVIGKFESTAIRLFALSAKDGRPLWVASHDEYLFRPVVHDDLVIIGARGSVLAYALATGKVVARLELPEGSAATTLVATGGGALAIDDEAMLRLLAVKRERSLFRSTVRLEQIWQVALEEEGVGHPLELGGRIMVLTKGGAILVFSRDDGRQLGSHRPKKGMSGAGGLTRSGPVLVQASGRTVRLFHVTDFLPDEVLW
ncbi:PQQ-binding-like beta-propeller repeat protein [Aquamicrobium sp.]|uniref:outer membrane protein assembly factor BamB family protein n=1 Tax=Aquamicrobium sp. TaxID=1872579 RepID=UPI002583586B|nr:PQQ-binding-like beta-propeller repeat protein [Aquamicrobium sp.]MCK9549227.1 PQQ-like beta-propeller repeat protein [Aquamicrobium sp.]